VCPTLSFPVSREKVQGLGSGRFVSIGEWWGSGDRLWSLMEFFVHFVCNIFVCSCSVVGGGCGIHVSNDERGTIFVFIYWCASQSGRLVLLVLLPEGQ